MQLVDWVRDGTPTPVTAEHARHVIDIIESAYRSAETGQRTEFDDSVLIREPRMKSEAATDFTDR